MATASTIKIDVLQQPITCLSGMTKESADLTSSDLQKNHDEHHIFYNEDGFHDHIVHHLLTLYALGASPQLIDKQYKANASYQRAKAPVDQAIVQDMNDPAKFAKHLGNEKEYSNFLAFFKEAIEEKGWQDVLNEYLFKSDDRADDMLVRTFAGFLHPLIHLGFGIEFEQPAIIAEALAQAAVHSTWVEQLYLGAEKTAAANGHRPSKSLVSILDDMKNDAPLTSAPHFDDANKIRDGILVRAPDRMLHYASQYRVSRTASKSELAEKCAEMINFTAYFTAAAQPFPHKHVKLDFFHIHCLNCSIFFPTLLAQDWLSTANKARLLEWKARTDLTMWVSRGATELNLDEIEKHVPKRPEDGWMEIAARVEKFRDDGHASKVIRALMNGEKVCAPYGGRDDFRIKPDMWLKLGHMAIDSVEFEAPEKPTWVRSCGFKEAWEDIGERPRAQLQDSVGRVRFQPVHILTPAGNAEV